MDLWSTGLRKPDVDTTQDLNATFQELKNHVLFVATRKFDTGDMKDFVIEKVQNIPFANQIILNLYRERIF